jgi:ABC-type oligopeptide transport system ATPase subunit
MLLELKGVKKYFSQRRGLFEQQASFVRAVDDVDLSIKSGENLGLVGESGSGKTTLGRLILKLYPVDSGKILFEGKNISSLTQSQFRPLRRQIQMVFQDPYSSLDPRYTVRNILKEAEAAVSAAVKTTHRNVNIDELMRKSLKSVGLPEDSLARFPHEFSGGGRQRIAIARALIMEPKLLILDEAVSSLDVIIQEQIIELLKDLQRQYQVTYCFITHNLRVVKKLSQQIAVMYRGKIVETGPAKVVFENPLHPYTQELLSAAIHYRSSHREFTCDFNENSRLIDKGGGHFVVD